MTLQTHLSVHPVTVISGNTVTSVTTQREAEIGSKFSYRLKQIPVGSDGDGDQVTSCVVEKIGGSSAQSDLSGRDRKSLDIIKDHCASNGVSSILRGVLQEILVKKGVVSSDLKNPRDPLHKICKILSERGFIKLEGDAVHLIEQQKQPPLL